MRATTNLVLDVLIAAAFLVAANPPVLGLAVHEWFGLAFGVAVVAHAALHWEWMVAATRRVFSRAGAGLRLNCAVDALLLVSLTAVVLSGLLISKHVLPALGLPPELSRGWSEIHSLAANTSVVALGVHLGLHWRWIALHLPRLAGVCASRSAAVRGDSALAMRARGHGSPGPEQPSTASASYVGEIVK